MINTYITKMYNTLATLLAFPFESALLVGNVLILTNALEEEFLVILVVLILVMFDTILGIMVGIKERKVSSKKFSDLFTKIIVYVILLIATHLPVVVFKDTISQLMLQPVQSTVLVAVVLRELISILEKSQKLNIFKIPKKLADKLAEYNDYVN